MRCPEMIVGCTVLDLITVFCVSTSAAIHGRYTRNIHDYEELIPQKVTAEGAFVSFALPHFFAADGAWSDGWSAEAEAEAEAEVHYALPLGARTLQVRLRPNKGLVAPGAVAEHGLDGASRPLRAPACHWRGHLRVLRSGEGAGEGEWAGRAALSTCAGGGLAGALRLPDGSTVLLEPLRGESADASGRLRHVAFRRVTPPSRAARHASSGGDADPDGGAMCGAHDWRKGWRERYKRELLRGVPPARLRAPRHVSDAAGATTGASANASAAPGSPRGGLTKKRTLELFLVADKKFIDEHKEDAQNYLLTLMNVAADMWSDASTGGYFSLSITRLMMMEKLVDPLELHLGQDAENVLDSFMEWADKLNPEDTTHPNHHDIAVLMTHFDLCSDNMTNCNLLGLASVSAACDRKRSACINEDAGLIAGFTVAHEIGHVMGASHDAGGEPGKPDGCNATDPDGAGWVMAAYLTNRISIWSNCSRGFFQALLRGGLGECLLDEPPAPVVPLPEVLPGLLYGGDAQCRMYMKLDSACAAKRDEMCERLWCSNGSVCTTQGRPAADGTACAEGRWCAGGACVEAGRRPHGVDGGWGSWMAWSACSRSCGGGVETRERLCDNPQPTLRGRHCLGERRRFRVCNAQLCDAAQPDFRSVQCSAFDSKPWWGDKALHTWKPRLEEDKPCKLYCLNEDHVYDALADVAEDGTPCRRGSRDMCVRGDCVNVGCDWGLQSGLQEDVCGVCGGDASHCKKEEKLWTEIGRGYTKVVTVPVGAHNLRVEELKPSGNMVALADKEGSKYCINGANRQDLKGEFDCPGGKALLSYPEPDQDLITVKGPTKEEMTVYYSFYGKPNPGVKVTWYTQEAGAAGPPPSYKWEFLEWADCDVTCGGGTQVSVAECVEKNAGRVSDSFCPKAQQPEAKSRLCNEQPCQAKWVAGEWGACSGCIFRSGLQRRAVECMREAPRRGQDPAPSPPEACDPAARPLDTRLCNSKNRCTGGLLFQTERPVRAAAANSSVSSDCIAKDPAPASAFEVEEVPLVALSAVRGNGCDVGLSDEAQEAVGDLVPAYMADLSRRRVFKGKDAEVRLKQIRAQAQHHPV